MNQKPIETVSSQRAASCEHLARHFTADESKNETPNGVPWSVPRRGITGHQRGPLFESVFDSSPEWVGGYQPRVVGNRTLASPIGVGSFGGVNEIR